MPVPVLNRGLKVPLSSRRRELMHRVMDGRSDLGPTMFMIHNYTFCDNFLHFLIHHHYTGDNLADILVKKFGSSVPRLINFMVEVIGKASVNAARSN